MTADERHTLRHAISRARQAQIEAEDIAMRKLSLLYLIEERAKPGKTKRADRSPVFAAMLPGPTAKTGRCQWCGKRSQAPGLPCRDHREVDAEWQRELAAL